jgi:hypothetical protein
LKRLALVLATLALVVPATSHWRFADAFAVTVVAAGGSYAIGDIRWGRRPYWNKREVRG